MNRSLMIVSIALTFCFCACGPAEQQSKPTHAATPVPVDDVARSTEATDPAQPDPLVAVALKPAQVDLSLPFRPAVEVAFCPERITQGYALKELYELPQIVSGSSPAAVRRAKELFRLLTPDLVELPPREAELAKLFANTYRYVNFAVSNQLYLIAQRHGADFARIHAAAKLAPAA